MLEPKNAIIRQYQKFFEMEDCKLEFEDKAMREIARIALTKDTGVRAIRSMIEELLLDVLYELPDRKDVARYVVTPELVSGEGKILTHPRSKKKRESA